MKNGFQLIIDLNPGKEILQCSKDSETQKLNDGEIGFLTEVGDRPTEYGKRKLEPGFRLEITLESQITKHNPDSYRDK